MALMTSSLLSSYMTGTLLNAFIAVPREGLIYVPHAMVDDTVTDFSVPIPLTNQLASRFAQSVDRLLTEARLLDEEQAEWGVSGGVPLVDSFATWEISSFPEWELRSFDEDPEDTGPQGLNLAGPQGRKVRIDMRNQEIELEVGTEGPFGKAFQTVFVDSQGEVSGSSYLMEFLDVGIDGLRTFLEIEGAPLIEVALELSRWAYQFYDNDEERLAQALFGMDNDEAKPFNLQDDDSIQAILEAFSPEGHFSIESAQRVTAEGRTKETEPLIYVHGEHGEGGDSYLSIQVRRLPSEEQQLFPLASPLYEIWRGARLWAGKRSTL